MRKDRLFTLLLLLSAGHLLGQDKLLLASGDTLTGKIEIFYPDTRYEEISYDDGDTKQRLKAYEFVGFIKDDQAYKSIKNSGKYQIMKLEKGGYMSLYRYRIENAYTFAGLYAQLADGNGMEISNLTFKKSMARFLEGCNAVSVGVKDGDYKRKDINKIVDDYNACIDRKTIEMENNQPDTELAAAATTAQVVTDENPLLTEANALLKEAQSMNEDELATMLEDIMEKISEGEEIPSYLKKAMEQQVDESNPLYSKIQQLLKQL